MTIPFLNWKNMIFGNQSMEQNAFDIFTFVTSAECDETWCI